MIQRIQTIFLLFVAADALLLLSLPLVTYTAGAETFSYSLLPIGLREGTSPVFYGMFAANLGILILSIAAIFQYKNRKRQLKTTRVLILLAAMLMGLLFVFPLYNADGYIRTYNLAAYLPAIVIILALLAGMFIKKDEELVRSADRIR